jgi:hypothetical protein
MSLLYTPSVDHQARVHNAFAQHFRRRGWPAAQRGGWGGASWARGTRRSLTVRARAPRRQTRTPSTASQSSTAATSREPLPLPSPTSCRHPARRRPATPAVTRAAPGRCALSAPRSSRCCATCSPKAPRRAPRPARARQAGPPGGLVVGGGAEAGRVRRRLRGHRAQVWGLGRSAARARPRARAPARAAAHRAGPASPGRGAARGRRGGVGRYICTTSRRSTTCTCTSPRSARAIWCAPRPPPRAAPACGADARARPAAAGLLGGEGAQPVGRGGEHPAVPPLLPGRDAPVRPPRHPRSAPPPRRARPRLAGARAVRVLCDLNHATHRGPRLAGLTKELVKAGVNSKPCV